MMIMMKSVYACTVSNRTNAPIAQGVLLCVLHSCADLPETQVHTSLGTVGMLASTCTAV